MKIKKFSISTIISIAVLVYFLFLPMIRIYTSFNFKPIVGLLILFFEIALILFFAFFYKTIISKKKPRNISKAVDKFDSLSGEGNTFIIFLKSLTKFEKSLFIVVLVLWIITFLVYYLLSGIPSLIIGFVLMNITAIVFTIAVVPNRIEANKRDRDLGS